VHYKLFTTEFNIVLAEGMAKIGELRESMALINEAVLSVKANGDLIYMPELLRVRGNVLGFMPEPDIEEAEACFTQSLELSRQQCARAWELRTAIDLARLWGNRGKRERGRTLLQPILEQFVEGRDTADPMTAARLLAGAGSIEVKVATAPRTHHTASVLLALISYFTTHIRPTCIS
jgi:hypothetical protein